MKIKIRHFHSFAPERKKRRWKRWLALVLIVLCVGSLIYVTNLEGYQIKSITITGAVFTDETKVKEVALQNIAGKYFFIIPKTFFWTYPKGAIKSQIQSLLSVSDSQVKVDIDSGTLNINISELSPKYLWCSSDGKTGDERPDCFYMNENGFIFTKAPHLEGNVFISFSGLVVGDALGQSFLPKAKMAELIVFLDSLKEIEFMPKSVQAVTMTNVTISLQSGADLIISLDKPLISVLENLKILKSSPDFIKASGGVENIKYIDLRYGAKAFWK